MRLGPLKETAPAEAEAEPKRSTNHARERYEADAPQYFGTPSIMREPLR